MFNPALVRDALGIDSPQDGSGSPDPSPGVEECNHSIYPGDWDKPLKLWLFGSGLIPSHLPQTNKPNKPSDNVWTGPVLSAPVQTRPDLSGALDSL
jgi:hypothetical protein